MLNSTSTQNGSAKPNRLRTSVILLVVLTAVFLVAPHLYANQSLVFTIMTFIVLAQGLNLLYGFTGYLP
ncbi:MAG: branched-chain amino acid ABC transporter permease, partial [Bordetella sp.]